MSDIGKVSLTEIELGKADLLLLQNALNEILHGIDVAEFETRIGATRDQAASLLQRLQARLDRM
jgi:hypothetical protein